MIVETEISEQIPGVALAGSTYRGVGIPACIDSGRNAVRALVEA